MDVHASWGSFPTKLWKPEEMEKFKEAVADWSLDFDELLGRFLCSQLICLVGRGEVLGFALVHDGVIDYMCARPDCRFTNSQQVVSGVGTAMVGCLVSEGYTRVLAEDEVLNGWFRSRGFVGEKVLVLGREREVFSQLIFPREQLKKLQKIHVSKPDVATNSQAYGPCDYQFQGEKGSMKIVSVSPIEVVAEAESNSTPGKKHIVLYRPHSKTSSLSCGCPIWIFNKKGDRTCWHTDSLDHVLEDFLASRGLDLQLRPVQ